MTKENAFIWDPRDHDWVKDSHLARFMAEQGFSDFDALYKKSVEDTNWFWESVMEDLQLSWFEKYETIQDRRKGFPWTRWFVNGEINITYNCVDRHVDAGHGEEVAIIYESDSGREEEKRVITYKKLSAMINQCAGALKDRGVGTGDFVALYAPMRVETAVVLFATMKIGARFVPIFCGFGEDAVVDRLTSCQAKIFFVSQFLSRRGKKIEGGAIAKKAQQRVPSIEELIFIDTEMWDQFLEGAEPLIEGEKTAAEEPCLVIHTSGTTGKPKGTVHTHAGILAQVGKELFYAFDVKPGETFFWFTDIGWMMGPWEIIGCLLFRTPVLFFDGAPDYPTGDRLWEMLERNHVVTFGISPTAVRMLMRLREGKGPQGYDLSRLRILGSTGETWDEASYQWHFEKVGGKRCPIMNISGGTEIMGCHLQPYPVMPLKPLTLGKGALGMDVDVFDEEGQSLRETVGYLVCKQPAPSMTKSFLHDDARYLETYFAQFEGVWSHGDWASIDADGYWFLHGRADDTIKVAGKRTGPAEIESILISHDMVSEAATIGVPDSLKGEALVCFVVMKEGASFEEATLKQLVAQKMGKPLTPKVIYPLTALPKTRSGKVVRGAIKKVFLSGKMLEKMGTIENPAALAPIAQLRETVAT